MSHVKWAAQIRFHTKLYAITILEFADFLNC